MADIQFFQEDTEDNQDDGDGSIGTDDVEGCSPDEGLTPLQRLQKYVDSDNIFSRQMVARSLLDMLRQVAESDDDPTAVLKATVQLSEDPEPTVRNELMDQVPHIAMFCHDNKDLFDDPIPTYLLPVIIKYLMDANNQVRKTSQAALLVLLEQGLISAHDVAEQVCPVITELAQPESIDDLRTEAVALMSKMAPLLGKEVTEKMFLPRFADMCTDAVFHVRKVCAANFGDMCSVVGPENTETHLLPKFFYLCEDAVWGVRKACVECFMQVSCTCSLDVRRTQLAQLFVRLICDQSRWVRMAAFQALGCFISTFADPTVTGLYYNEDGNLTVENIEDHANQNKSNMSKTDNEDCTNSAEKENNCECDANRDSDPDAVAEGSSAVVAMEVDDGGGDIDTDKIMVALTEDGDGSDMSLEERRAGHCDKMTTQTTEPERLTAEETPVVCDNNDTAESGSSSNSRISASDNQVDGCANSPQMSEPAGTVDDWGSNNECRTEVNNCIDAEYRESSDDDEDVFNSNSENDDCKESDDIDDELEGDGYLNTDDFGYFLYWRDPLPVVTVVLNEVSDNKESPSQPVVAKESSQTVVNGDKNNPTSEDLVGSEKSEDCDETSENSNSMITTSKEQSSDELESDVAAGMENVNLDDDEEEADQDVCETTEDVDEDGVTIYTANVSTVCQTAETVTNFGSTHVLGQSVNETTMTIVNGIVQDLSSNLGFWSMDDTTSEHGSSEESCLSMCVQDVIPQPLLNHYLSMIDPSRAQTVDTEIARHCAFSLPAVAYTLGRKHWPCLKELYDTLSVDMQWKVRRSLAFSIHELAVIVGEDVTHNDLVPVFNGFLKDLDEVRIGILKHLADFLRLLKPSYRLEYLTKIQEFLNTDNNRNWRFREELAQQLIQLLDLYSPEHICEHLVPVAMALAEDKVAEIRQRAFRVLSYVIRTLSECDNKKLLSSLIRDIIKNFAEHNKWSRRQMYAQVCQHILQEQAFNPSMFAEEMLPHLLFLRKDSIANVRISLAKTLTRHIACSEYFTSAQNPHHQELLETMQTLRSDSDRDVRYFASYISQTYTSDMDAIPV